MELLRDGPIDAATTVVLAHGAGSGMRHEFLQAVAAGFAAAGLAVVRFEFAYRAAGHRRPDPMPQLLQRLRETVALAAPRRLVLAGKSMGGRVATMLADELGAASTVVFGYPFHPPKQPAKVRTAHLATLRTPTLILQGERDPFGTPADVAGYCLPPSITVRWFADGDHSLVPRQRSGHHAADHFQSAMAAAVAFVSSR
ncbi:MAG: alpha/beta fold hydrolase [Planctomycetes bacterium]|nr:alpha/beta fold hydrolase [Planctomycetota bacterium]